MYDELTDRDAPERRHWDQLDQTRRQLTTWLVLLHRTLGAFTQVSDTWLRDEELILQSFGVSKTLRVLPKSYTWLMRAGDICVMLGEM